MTNVSSHLIFPLCLYSVAPFSTIHKSTKILVLQKEKSEFDANTEDGRNSNYTVLIKQPYIDNTQSSSAISWAMPSYVTNIILQYVWVSFNVVYVMYF